MPLVVGTTPTALEEFPSDSATVTYLGDSDIVLSGGTIPDNYGCRWRRSGSEPWGGKPSPREQVGDRPYDDGQWDATRYYDPRVISIAGHCLAPTHYDLHIAKQRLYNTIGVDTFRLRITEPGYDSFAEVRQQGEILWAEINPKTAAYSFSVYARDPLLYSMLERAFSIGFPAITGGLEWPATWPATWDATGPTGQTTLGNPGALPIGLELRIDGPITGSVSMVLSEAGQTLNLDNPDGDLLAADQYLIVDTVRRKVLLNGTSSRRAWMYGDWLHLPPGTDSTFAVSADGAGTGAAVSGTYRVTRL